MGELFSLVKSSPVSVGHSPSKTRLEQKDLEGSALNTPASLWKGL